MYKISWWINQTASNSPLLEILFQIWQPWPIIDFCVIWLLQKTLWMIFNFLVSYKLAMTLFKKVKQVLDDLNLFVNDICGQLYDNKAVMMWTKHSFKTWTSTQYVLCLVSLNSLEKMSLPHYQAVLTWIQHFATIICVLFRVIWQMKYF